MFCNKKDSNMSSICTIYFNANICLKIQSYFFNYYSVKNLNFGIKQIFIIQCKDTKAFKNKEINTTYYLYLYV